jgi:hypothetical protein
VGTDNQLPAVRRMLSEIAKKAVEEFILSGRGPVVEL